ncbi:MAG: TRAP transporter small permease [Gammaproteobacteria bacterium]|nr:TRAP transporter small permease [Gammaproteobacteria bacterium]
MHILFARLDRALNRLYTWSGYAAAFFLVAIGVLVCANIISRLVSGYVPGLTQYSGYAMAASSFFGLAYTFHHNEHIRVEVLLSHLRGQARWFAELWCLVAASVVSAYLAWYLYRLVYYSWLFQEHSEGADATLLWIPQTATVLGALVLVVCVVHRLVRVAVTGSVGKGAGGDG